MCLIIKKPANVAIGMALIEQAIFQNKDGWGIMWAENGAVNTVKGFGIEELLAAINLPSFCASEGFVHFRWGTSGLINDENCHPFRVTNNIYMMHNGVFNVTTPHKDMSDTWHFVKYYLRPMLVAYPTRFLDSDWIKDLEYFVGSNKVVILNSDGNSGIVNEKMWHKRDGLLLSNLNSCPIVFSQSNWDRKFFDSRDRAVVYQGQSFVDINKDKAVVVYPKQVIGNTANSVEEMLDEEFESKYRNRKFAKQVALELAERGIEDDDVEDGYEYDDDDDQEEELQAYFAQKKHVPSTFRELQGLGYEELKSVCLSNPEAIASLVWSSDLCEDTQVVS